MDFRTDGGATWLNLLATSGRTFGERPVERLQASRDLAAWLDLMGFATTGSTSADVERARAVREALRGLAMSSVEGREPAAQDVARVDEALRARGPISVVPTTTSVGAALAEIAAQALVTLRGPDAGLLKECDERDCRWVFLDVSGRRRWCPSPACASRGRVRAHRAALAGR
ncbi:CGNR zinc finger domain-containing protein [Cellulomonas rhizosphaerae]|uniref:Zf-CGNR multi-domain protein n=1 Tax=Cellulomonas rhizosphaerae TaxID=2293719 RepID=A0A413RLD6_9CELL|nr:CGNR zinc finger domain-containing protein [Cellulomonas rhizosphaerae]RHA40735.1 zf-CGNR multi-domain protein [Cellulomonas rhizosphaerae]